VVEEDVDGIVLELVSVLVGFSHGLVIPDGVDDGLGAVGLHQPSSRGARQ
jgi:hypothetical protein